jgi:hypothetical protein
MVTVTPDPVPHPKENPRQGEMPGLRAGGSGWWDRIRPP